MMYTLRELIENQSELICTQRLMDVLPTARFFTPTNKFWEHLKTVMQDNDCNMVLEGGSGSGHLLEESTEQGVRMAGCDIIKRENHFEGNHMIQIMPAHMFPQVPNTLWLVCRPDHSGWARALLEKCQEEGIIFIYVGLRKNMALDLDHHMMETPHTTYIDVGEEGETMLVFLPNSN